MSSGVGQVSLFDGTADGPSSEERIEGVGLDLRLVRGWLSATEADEAFSALLSEVPWEQHHITVFGNRSPVPRLDSWLGDPGADYAYSGIDLTCHRWTPTTSRLRSRLTGELGEPFNAVLANRYRHGRDGVAWHADDEAELGPEPLIAAVSLGATRAFQLKRRAEPGDRRCVELRHGDLVVMAGRTQAEWLHQVPKTARPVGERVSLTFRRVVSTTP